MPDFDAREVGRNVRHEREKAGLSLAQLAEVSGLTKPYLVRLENQGGNPTLEVLNAIADALDVTVADLIGGPKVVADVGGGPEPPPSLKAFASEEGLNSADVRMLASIRWRKGQHPRSPERWRFIYDSLRASQGLERSSGGDGD